MSEMVERVARALARCDGGKITGPSRHKASDEFSWDPSHHYMNEYVEKHWREQVNAAYMAIGAMRELPPSAFVGSVRSYADERGNDYEDHAEWWAETIDLALTPAPPEQ